MEWVINVARRQSASTNYVHFFEIRCQSTRQLVDVYRYLVEQLDETDLQLTITRWDHVGYDVTADMIKIM